MIQVISQAEAGRHNMRVLWTSNILLPSTAQLAGLPPLRGGSWIDALAAAIACNLPEVELGIVTMHPGLRATEKFAGAITNYIVPCRSGDLVRRPSAHVYQSFSKVLADYQPTLIHVQGSEYSYGLVMTDIVRNLPILLSIQGLITECAKHYWGGMALFDLLRYRTLRDWVRLDGMIEQKWKWKLRSRMEREIVKRMVHVVGRTDWDRAYTRLLSPHAQYYHCDEALRAPFFETKWEVLAERRHIILASSSLYAIKGFHILLDAVRLLREVYPDIELRVPGSTFTGPGCHLSSLDRLRRAGYAQYVTGLIGRYGLRDNVVSLGSLGADRMAWEMANARAFILPSFIENSPNSLAEAMLVGTPSVVAYVGGVSSMATDGIDALFHQSGDSVMIAERIRAIIDDDSLARRLSENARQRALARYRPERIVSDLVSIYHSVLSPIHRSG